MSALRRRTTWLTATRSLLLLLSVAYPLHAGGGLLFAGAQRLENGDTPLAVAAADFDHDGFVDLLFEGGYVPTQTLRAVRGVGSGAFVGDVVQFDATGTQVVSLLTHDFDGDGLLDAALADTGAKRIRVWMDDDSVSWPPFEPDAVPDLYAFTFAPTAMGAGDIDGDGDVDLVCGGKNEVGVLLNAGAGFAYAAGTTFGGASSASAVVVADLSGDGLDDLILATPVRIRVFQSLGAGAFAAPVSVHDAGVTTDDALAVLDVDQDGALDLVAAFPTGVAWLRGDGLGGLAPPVAITDVPAQRLLLDDMNADGLTDVVVADELSVRTLVSHGDGSFIALQGTPLLPPVTDLGAGDVNGDGRRDVLAAHEGGIAVLENRGDAHWPKPIEFPAPTIQSGEPEAPAACDLDGDGDLELVLGLSNAPRIYVNPGPDGVWGEPLVLHADAEAGEIAAVLAADLDGAFGADVVALSGDTVTVWLSTGPLLFGPPVTIESTAAGSPAALFDVDLDGDLDLVATGAVLLNDGSGAFATPALGSGGWDSFALADFDGDGLLDRATKNDDEVGAVGLSKGHGDGTFEFVANVPTISHRVRASDLNADGLPDLLLVFKDTVVVHLNQGGFAFGPKIDWYTGQPGIVYDTLAADVDGVPGDEIVCAADRQLLVLHQEAGDFIPHSGYAAKATIRSLRLADIDADGDLDALLGVSNGPVAMLTLLTGRSSDPWKGLSGGLAGAHGLPELSGTGSLRPGTPMSLHVSRAAANASVVLVAGLQTLDLPFKGGTLVPAPQLPVSGLVTSALGTVSLGASWPPGLASGQGLVLQAWIADAAGPAGFSATNALVAVQP